MFSLNTVYKLLLNISDITFVGDFGLIYKSIL